MSNGLSSLNKVFQDIGVAINAKGISGLMTPMQMADNIYRIQQGGGSNIDIGWYGKPLSSVEQLSIINITRDDYYSLPENEKNLSGVQYIVSSDTYLNWPYQVSIDFLSSEIESQDTIVSCINSILSVFKHVNIDANQFLHLVTIPALSSPVASQDTIVNTINTMLSAYKNQVGPIEIKGGDSSKVTIRTWND